MKKYTFSSLISQFILLIFVIVWIIPTFGLFVTSFRDKDLLSTSGWWTSLITNEVNEIYRTENNESQILENNLYVIKSNLFENINKKKITSFGITSKNINEFIINDIATLKDGSKITVYENGDYIWTSEKPFENKKGKRIFITASSPPTFTIENYKEVLFKEGVGQAFINTLTVAIPSTVIPLIICSFFAYALSWFSVSGVLRPSFIRSSGQIFFFRAGFLFSLRLSHF